MPAIDAPKFPSDIGSALSHWSDWPMLTPTLRKTLNYLSPLEQAALVTDLEDGSGDVFVYADVSGKVKKVSAWPLPASLCEGLKECVFEDRIKGLEKAGHDILLGALFDLKNRELLEPGLRRMRQLYKLLAKLDMDESRLLQMVKQGKNAEVLSTNLWRLNHNAKQDIINLDGLDIALDKRLSLTENMERMFHEMRRGKRGLALLAERRSAVRQELALLEAGKATAQGVENIPETTRVKIRERTPNMPRHTEAFVSTDGYVILRGKDTTGNLAIRRLASGHDIWVHVEHGVGAHVIIRRPHPGCELPEHTLAEAGTLAANKSWLAKATSGSVMYAEVRHVRPIRNAAHGKVVIDRLRDTRTVVIDHSLEEKLKSPKI